MLTARVDTTQCNTYVALYPTVLINCEFMLMKELCIGRATYLNKKYKQLNYSQYVSKFVIIIIEYTVFKHDEILLAISQSSESGDQE